MDVHQIIGLLPADLLTKLAVETKVNHYAKKLQGAVIFKLLLSRILGTFCLLKTTVCEPWSQRMNPLGLAY